MIEDKDFCKKQITRVEKFAGFPSEREAFQDLVTAIQNFDTREQAQKFMDDWTQNETICPKPADIRRAAYDARERDNTAWLEAKKCPHCSGSGFRMTVRFQRAAPAMPPARYEYSERCDHADRGCDHSRNSWCGATGTQPVAAGKN